MPLGNGTRSLLKRRPAIESANARPYLELKRMESRLDGQYTGGSLRIRLASHPYFQYSGYMELKQAIDAFASLAQETRLQVFKLLTEYGRSGTPAGKLSERLGIPQNTLSFHLSHLSRAGLLNSKRDGKQIIYSANCDSIEELILYLKENCCILENPADGSAACCPSPQIKEGKKSKGGRK